MSAFLVTFFAGRSNDEIIYMIHVIYFNRDGGVPCLAQLASVVFLVRFGERHLGICRPRSPWVILSSSEKTAETKRYRVENSVLDAATALLPRPGGMAALDQQTRGDLEPNSKQRDRKQVAKTQEERNTDVAWGSGTVQGRRGGATGVVSGPGHYNTSEDDGEVDEKGRNEASERGGGRDETE
ncbi:hypothetical protein BGW80DRAFT_1444907 [Lactifluus volemus]|nr:hypothetical protein BGW80DRAFT_1444907 [Lactifluus volemus]